jgi:predicted acylesterase/phospholipase RssA
MNTNNRVDDCINNVLNKKDKKIDTLVISGGALKGIAQLGALQYLKENNILNNIKTIAATSIGTVNSLLYICGYEPIEIYKLLSLINIQNMNEFKFSSVINKFGFDDGKRLMLVIEKLLKEKNISKNITFEKLYSLFSINFIVTGTCLNDKKVYYFSHMKYPKMKVLKAIRISISAPIIFTPIKYENKLNKLENVIGIYTRNIYDYVDNINCIEKYLLNLINSFYENTIIADIENYIENTIYIKCKDKKISKEYFIELFENGYNTAKCKFNNNK